VRTTKTVPTDGPCPVALRIPLIAAARARRWEAPKAVDRPPDMNPHIGNDHLSSRISQKSVLDYAESCKWSDGRLG
jgi:hypothetical protein